MPRIYNGEEHRALEAEKTRLEQELETVSVRMNDEFESDAWDDPEKSHGKIMRYNADNLLHARLSRELESVARQIDRMEEIRPLSASERRNTMRDITRRWMAGGSAMLDEGERQAFVKEVPDDAARLLRAYAGSGQGEVFDPWAIATDSGEVPLPPRMAAGDPSRSDISEPSASGADDAMGQAAPQTWATGLVEALQYFGSVASNCHNFNTSDGNDFHQNQMDTADEEGGKITDQSQAGTGTPGDAEALANVGTITFRSSWRHSKFIDVRIETLDDIHFDVAGRVMRDITRRLGRGWNKEFTQGVANGAQGIVPSAKVVDGKAASLIDGGAGKGLDYANLLDMEYAIDLAYLEADEGGDGGFMDAHGGMIGWMMNRLVEKNLRFATLIAPHGGTGTGGLPIWVPDPTNVGVATQRAPARILGYPYSINQHMDPGTANNQKPLLFGSCGHYGVRNIGGPMMYRFWDSAMASRMAVRFIGFSRRDGRCRGPGTLSTPNAVGGTATACEAYAALQVKT